MKEYHGTLLKMQTSLKGIHANYVLPLSDHKIDMMSLIGRKISLKFTGHIHCIHSGKKIKKTFGQGYSYPSFKTLPECDICMVLPEKCHLSAGTCRDPSWGKRHCQIPHIIYLAFTSNIKIGITRHTQTPHRWIDQGAIAVLPILQVEDRLTAGLLEKEIKEFVDDKTNWRKMLTMLTNSKTDPELSRVKETIFYSLGDILDDLMAEEIHSPPLKIQYPFIRSMQNFTMKSFSFEKINLIEDVLIGIKGQYLIFPSGVLNIRKHQGYSLLLKRGDDVISDYDFF